MDSGSGDPTHHARMCSNKTPVDVDSGAKRNIQFRKANGTGVSKVLFPEKHATSISQDRNLPLPDVTVVKKSVYHLLDSLMEMDEDFDAIEATRMDVNGSAETSTDLVSLKEMRHLLSEYGDTIYETGWITKKFISTWPDDDEILVLRYYWEDLEEKYKKLQNKTCVLLNNRSAAIKVYQKCKSHATSIIGWLLVAPVMYSGRTWDFLEIKKQKKLEKAKLADLMVRYKCVFPQDVVEDLEQKFQYITTQWKAVSAEFK